MGTQRHRQIYAETMDNRTFKIIHIKVKTSCCLKCKRRANHKWYHVSWSNKRQNVFPNWKLVSKNKKQWMEKPLRFKADDRWFIDIKW